MPRRGRGSGSVHGNYRTPYTQYSSPRPPFDIFMVDDFFPRAAPLNEHDNHLTAVCTQYSLINFLFNLFLFLIHLFICLINCEIDIKYIYDFKPFVKYYVFH